jgi:Fe-S-cluster containining protein
MVPRTQFSVVVARVAAATVAVRDEDGWVGKTAKSPGRGSGRTAEGRMRALAELYERLPQMHCQGLCADSCYSLVQTRLEQQYVLAQTGVRLGLVQTPPTACPALGVLNRCTVREARPMICRLWGMTAGMRCQYGCEPEGGVLSAQQTYEFLAQVAELDGDVQEAARLREPFRADPEAAERAMLAAQRQRDLDYEQRVRSAANPVFVVRPGRLSKERPRGGRW